METDCEICNRPYKTMDDCYHAVIDLLTSHKRVKEVSTELVLKEKHSERVLYLFSILEQLSFFPFLKTITKDNKAAKYYRNRGNEFYTQQNNYLAWQYYNLSLLHAYTMSEDFVFAVSNRSAVFHAMGEYEACLEDIKFVFSSPYPEPLKDKLMKRKQQCEAELAKSEVKSENKRKEEIDAKISELLAMKSPKHEKYLSASSKLKVVYTEEMGRHVIANEDIKVGEVLVEEDPYVALLLKPQFLFTCAYCFSRKLNLYPCRKCPYTLYCSVACREEAFNKYHMLECTMMPSLLTYNFSKLEWLALRTTIQSRCDSEGWNPLFKVAKEADKTINTDEWGCVKVEGKWVYDSSHYAAIHTLATNFEQRSISDIFRKSLTAAVMMHFLVVMHLMKNDDPALVRKSKKYIADNILRHLMTSPTNMHSISTNIENADGKFVDECNIGSGAYAFLSLLNHSCTPNVVRYTKLGSTRMSLIAIRPIKKGMQIFDNYGYHHALLDRYTRQENLNFQYKFTCTCEACLDDWPTHDKLKPGEGIPPHILKKKDECLDSEVIDKLMTGDKETALKFYQPLCELIEVLDAFAPCKELAECQEAMKQCLAIFHGVVPFGYSRILEWTAYPPCKAASGPPHAGSYLAYDL